MKDHLDPKVNEKANTFYKVVHWYITNTKITKAFINKMEYTKAMMANT